MSVGMMKGAIHRFKKVAASTELRGHVRMLRRTLATNIMTRFAVAGHLAELQAVVKHACVLGGWVPAVPANKSTAE